MDPLPPDQLLNRELSWLDFNRRVLALASDDRLPLLERVRFLAIASRNLDEFFQVRVALLRARSEAGIDVLTADGRNAEQQIEAVREHVLEQTRHEQEVFAKDLLPQLAETGIEIVAWKDIEKAERKRLKRIFVDDILPVLTPLAVDPAHPFPYVSNLSFNLAVLVRDPRADEVRFARIKIPPRLGRFIALEDGRRRLPIEALIAAHLGVLFHGMEIDGHSCFRVTRDADLALEEEEAGDLLAAIESGLHRRNRLSDAVRLEIDDTMSPLARQLLLDELELEERDLYSRKGLLDFASLEELCALDRPDLKFERWIPQTQTALAPNAETGESPNLFDLLAFQDVLVHHPYDSFDSSVQNFLAQAADDPAVLTIKHTIYRTANPQENSLGQTLIRAARAGKQVVTLVELKARFDEQANIEWARTLEQAGVHVVYGLVGLKTHAKIALVVRQEADGIRRYCHVGTGNYHPGTARLYEDVGLLSADPDLGADLSDLFNHLTGYSRQQTYRKILVAPQDVRSGFIDQIREEMQHADGRIIVKCNSVSDPEMISALYDASKAGVSIDLLVRGICCLRPGVPEYSENIRVRSILGRFLEHSRIARFGSAERGYRYYLGSADWMPRNLDGRVEVVAPIEDPRLQERIEELLSACLEDDMRSWELQADGRWQRVETREGHSAQERLQELARERSRPE